MLRLIVGAVLVLAALLAAGQPATADLAEPAQVRGTQRLLVVATRFPGTTPSRSLDQIREKAAGVDRYIRMASYGKASVAPTVVGWLDMPLPLAEYKVSPFNYDVDRQRVHRLLADALGAARREVDLDAFDQAWIVVGAETRPGEGYGMIAYCANPGMLSGVRQARARLETVRLRGGGEFSRPAIVSADNAHVGHAAHDFLHALGGARGGDRVVPDLYDFDLQSRPPPNAPMLPSTFAIHVGPWDIMSQHFVDPKGPPPPPSSFTRLQLGWIEPGQVVDIAAGETRRLTLRPLASGKGVLVARLRLGEHRDLLVENRQPVGGDKVLPASGMVVLEVNRRGAEGRDIVKVADANPATPTLDDAPFRPESGERRAYVNQAAGVAVAPLALGRDGALEVLVTTPQGLGRVAK
jgi:M6 family metalloprotease-like protein